MRRCHLFSNAPIPALLHTCTESRLALVSMGYQIAFQTRSSGPRTWFNFNQDILVIGTEPSGDDSSSDGSSSADEFLPVDHFWTLSGDSLCNFSQFDPREMRQVRKLALRGAAEHLSMLHYDPESFDGPLGELSSVLRLFNNLEELLLVDWCVGDLTTTIAKDESETEHQRRHAYDTCGLWGCTDVSEVDGLLRLFSPKPPCAPNPSATGVKNCLLSDHKKTHGNEASYFGDTLDSIRDLLTEDMARLISTDTTGIVIPWKIPQLRTIHILSPLEYRALSHERLNVAQHICNLQKEWSSIIKSRMEKSLPSLEWNRVKRAFEETHWPEDNHRTNSDGSRCAWSDVMQKKWWIQEGPAPDVGELLL